MSLPSAGTTLAARLRWRFRWKRYAPTLGTFSSAENAVLQTRDERERAVAEIERLGLPLYADRPKNWDSLAALGAILTRTSRDARVLDAGAVANAVILPWLAFHGYRDLIGINLAVRRPYSIGPIRYERGDITKTRFPDASFDAITCLSVIEHGVPVTSYLTEMARLLRPGGVLVTSTDYWHEPVDTRGQHAWGAPVRVFGPDDIRGALQVAAGLGLRPTGALEYACTERVVHWNRMNLDYTFIVFTLVRD